MKPTTLVECDNRRSLNLRAAVNKDDSGMLPAGDQFVGFVQQAVKLEARLPSEAKDLWGSVVVWATCKHTAVTSPELKLKSFKSLMEKESECM